MRLNLRQMICSGAAIAVAVAVYLGLTLLLGHETAGWVCIVVAAPIAAAGFFTYDCLTFEKFLLVVIDSTVIRNDWPNPVRVSSRWATALSHSTTPNPRILRLTNYSRLNPVKWSESYE